MQRFRRLGTRHRYAATLNRSRHFTPAWAELLQTPAGHMHALLVERADALMGCPGSSPEEAELAALTDAIEARPLRAFGNEQGKVYAHTEHPPRRPSNMQAVCTATQPNNGRTSEIVRNPSGRFSRLWIGADQRDGPPLTLKSISRCRPASNSKYFAHG